MNKVHYLAGDSSIDIRGDNEISELRIVGQLLGLVWWTSDGTTIENLIQFRHPEGRAQLDAFCGATLEEFDEEVLIESVQPFLAAGYYRVTIADYYDLDAYLDEASHDLESPTSYYGGCYSMIATQSKSQLSEKTVNWFRAKIRNGTEPLVLGICVNASWADDMEDDLRTVFILDGHHRLEAYRLEGKKARICVIARIDPPPAAGEYQGLPCRW